MFSLIRISIFESIQNHKKSIRNEEHGKNKVIWQEQGGKRAERRRIQEQRNKEATKHINK